MASAHVIDTRGGVGGGVGGGDYRYGEGRPEFDIDIVSNF